MGKFIWTKWIETRWLKVLILVLLSLFSSILVFPNILNKSQTYKLGDIAAKDFKASHDFLVENVELTEKNRERSGKDVLAVYDFDRAALIIVAPIKNAFQQARDGLQKLSNAGPDIRPEDLTRLKTRFFATLDMPVDEEIFTVLIEQRFLPATQEAVIKLLKDISRDGIVGNQQMLKEQIEKSGILLHDISSGSEITVKDINRFHDLEQARDLIKKQKRSLRKILDSPELIDMSVSLAQALIKPNLTYNQRETEKRRDAIRQTVKPVYDPIKKGEMLVREGEVIGPKHLVKLEEEGRTQNRSEMIGRVVSMTVLIGLLFAVLYLVMLNVGPTGLRDERDLIFIIMVLVVLFLLIWLYNFMAEAIAKGMTRTLLFAMPIACGAMLISIFQGLGMAFILSLVISVFTTIFIGKHVIGEQVEFFLYFYINSLVAAYGVRNFTIRGGLIKSGIVLGITNVVLSLAINTIHNHLNALNLFEIGWAAVLGFLGGILTGVIATGILPLIEMSFGFTTDIRLLELGNLDHPLLRELMVQAPGTYHHSVIISNMVEVAAEAVKANPLLAKVSAYYHDIGKIQKPLYFIENQMGAENRHERLAPSMSSLILIAHVKDGVDLAKKHKLGREIIDIIQQHHGTNLISFFYHKAKERSETKGGKPADIKEEDYRYPGPKPQTKEAGLVLLADMIEATVRTLPDPSQSRIQGVVQKIINRTFSDGQLDECELTLKDLNQIAKGFNKILSGIFHQRIEYPETTPKAGKKVHNGNSDQPVKEGPGNQKEEDTTENGESLRRLGLS